MNLDKFTSIYQDLIDEEILSGKELMQLVEVETKLVDSYINLSNKVRNPINITHFLKKKEE